MNWGNVGILVYWPESLHCSSSVVPRLAFRNEGKLLLLSFLRIYVFNFLRQMAFLRVFNLRVINCILMLNEL